MKQKYDMFSFRIFTGDREKIRKTMRKFPDRFSSEAHFIRCAIINFSRQLDREHLAKRLEKVRQ